MWRAIVGCAAIVAALSLPAGASAAVTIGSNLANPPTLQQDFGCGSTEECSATVASTQVPSGSLAPGGLASPIDGVVVRFRLRTAVGTDVVPVRLRTVRSAGGGQYSGRGGTGTPVPLENIDGVQDFPAQLPIAAGDLLGLDAVDPGTHHTYLKVGRQPPGAESVLFLKPSLPDNVATTPFSTSNVEYLLSADVEADADKDGRGDETQDQCPADASTQGPCPPPPPATPPARDSVAPTGSLGRRSSFDLLRTLARGLTIEVTGSEAATVSGTALFSARLFRQLGARARGGRSAQARFRTVARGTTALAGPGRIATLRLTFTRAAKSRLRRARRVSLSVQIVLKDAAGNAATITKRVTLRARRRRR